MEREGEKIVVASVDAVGLYPNLDHRTTTRQCNKEIVESSVKVPRLDMRAATVFLASTMTRTEICERGLQDYVPERRWRKGQYPGLAKGELTTRTPVAKKNGEDPDKETDEKATFSKVCGSKWGLPRRVPAGVDERKVVGMVVEMTIMLVVNNHFYKFAGDIFLQDKGLPIGSRLTGSMARISMDQWSRGMDLTMEDNLIKKYLKAKYVDDVNLVVEAVGLGTRWADGSLR